MLSLKKVKIGGDKWLIILPLCLSVFGLLMIFDASYVAAIRDFNDKFHYLRLQTIWFFLGIVGFLFFSFFDYRLLKKTATPFFLSCLVLLIVVLIPGVGRQVLGGRRWIDIGGFGFQPAELTKLALVLYLAALFEKKRELFPFLLTVLVVLFLLLLEPDLGTAIVIVGTAFCLYFMSGASLSHFLLTALLLVAVIPFAVLFCPYRKARLLTFLNSSSDQQGASYHVRQVLLALGSGGIFGRGFGQSRQKFLFLPEVTTDSIFAVVGEEFGLIGAVILLSAFFFFIYKGIKTALLAPDRFGQLLAVGIIFFLGFQVVINLSAMVSLVPLTGVPLPFISYGGSSLVILLAASGILYNISKSAVRERRR